MKTSKKISINKVFWVVIILLIIITLPISFLSAQETLFDEESASSEEANNDFHDDTLFDDSSSENAKSETSQEIQNKETTSGNDCSEDFTMAVDHCSLKAPEPSLEHRIKVGYGTSLLFLNKDTIDERSPDTEQFQFTDVKAFSQIYLNGNYKNFNIISDFEIQANIDNLNTEAVDFFLNELYGYYMGESLVFYFGHFIINWSNADRFHLTDYFAPPINDLIRPYTDFTREGSTGMMLKYFINTDKVNITLEGVIIPISTFIEIPAEYEEKITASGLSIVNNTPYEANGEGFGIEDISAGAKISFSFKEMDFAFSYYHGYYMQSLPYSLNELTEVKTHYDKINSVGFNTSFGIANKISVRGEAVSTFDLPVCYELMNGLPTQKDNKVAIAYTVGFDFEIVSDLQFLTEYTDLWIIDAPENIEYSKTQATNKTILLNIDYSALNGKLNPFIAGIFNYESLFLNVASGMEIDLMNGFCFNF